ncbi:MAG: MTH938/NDUFAF3 family protein [Candidatus Hydrothermarchaeales archaeon]
MIDAYDFGRIVIDGKRYNRDVLILADKVKADWWRKEGHLLQIDDLGELVKEELEVLVIGTGYSGCMQISPEVVDYFHSKSIELVVKNTKDACKIFDELQTDRKAAAFHLTC